MLEMSNIHVCSARVMAHAGKLAHLSYSKAHTHIHTHTHTTCSYEHTLTGQHFCLIKQQDRQGGEKAALQLAVKEVPTRMIVARSFHCSMLGSLPVGLWATACRMTTDPSGAFCSTITPTLRTHILLGHSAQQSRQHSQHISFLGILLNNHANIANTYPSGAFCSTITPTLRTHILLGHSAQQSRQHSEHISFLGILFNNRANTANTYPSWAFCSTITPTLQTHILLGHSVQQSRQHCEHIILGHSAQQSGHHCELTLSGHSAQQSCHHSEHTSFWGILPNNHATILNFLGILQPF